MTRSTAGTNDNFDQAELDKFGALANRWWDPQGPQKALHALNPPCRLPIDDAVASLLPSWDISIEEVPWYLAKQFGRDEVLASVERLRSRQSDQTALTRLRTIEYWSGYTGRGITNRWNGPVRRNGPRRMKAWLAPGWPFNVGPLSRAGAAGW